MSTSASLSSCTTLGNNGPTDTTPEWTSLFDDPVKEDDEIWKEYNEEAAKFDTRMIGQWNNVIDGVLVYVSVDHFARRHWQLILSPCNIGRVVPFCLSSPGRRDGIAIQTQPCRNLK